jgi:hypothetical protein
VNLAHHGADAPPVDDEAQAVPGDFRAEGIACRGKLREQGGDEQKEQFLRHIVFFFNLSAKLRKNV